MSNDTITDLLIYVERAKIRKQVLIELSKREQVAFLLAKQLNTHRETISRAFLELTKKKLAICSNPKEHHFRKYSITLLGKEILEELNI